MSLKAAYQTILSEYNYSNYVVKNSSDTTKGTRTVEYAAIDTSKYQITSFDLITETGTKTITASSASGRGSLASEGYCDYSYTYSGGKLTVTVSNLSKAVRVQANVESAGTILNLTATNSAVNSLLMLTVMDGNECIAEYSCVSGTISISVALEQKKTYKILATRPFGSRLTVLLDGATLAPTNFACYEISTDTKNAMNLSFELTGDGSWKNCVVV